MIEYRQMTAEDIDTFARLRIRQLIEEGATADGDLLPALLDDYGRHLHDGTFISWLALDGERIVGTSGISIVEKPAWFGCPTGRIGLISSMYTDSAYRRMDVKALDTRMTKLMTIGNVNQAMGGVLQSMAQNLSAMRSADATREGAESTKYEEMLDQTKDLFAKAQSLIDQVISLYQSVIQMENQSMRDAIQA